MRKLVYFEAHGDVRTAIAREKQIKGGSRMNKAELTDAIAMLMKKEDVNAFNGNLTYGFYNANARGEFSNPTNGTDGNTLKLSGNYGIIAHGDLQFTIQ